MLDGDTFFHTYPLILACTASETGVELKLTYNVQFFSPIQAERLLFQFETVFEQFHSSNAQTRVGEIELTSPQDRRQIEAWNSQYPEQQTCLAHHVISARVDMQPDAEAVYG